MPDVGTGHRLEVTRVSTTEVVTCEQPLGRGGEIHQTNPRCSYVFVMTKSARTGQQRGNTDSQARTLTGDPRCRWCRHVLTPQDGPGRRREFCSQKCRQWDWVARQRASELALSENELVIAREELDTLKDQIYVLHCAVVDARRDLEKPRQTKETLAELISWLLEAAEPVAAASLSPALRP